MLQQTIFPLSKGETYESSEYIVSTSNQQAYHTINQWPKFWGVNPYPKSLILLGPQSSGKTFLAKKWSVRSNALLLDAKNMLRLTEQTLRDYDAFILDDVDKLHNHINDKMIFHWFNAINENNKYLLMTARKIPSFTLADLISRINALNVVSINIPDDHMMEMLIFKLFSNHSIIVNHEVIQYLTKILPREFSLVIDYINDINIYALRKKRKITIPLLKQALILS